MAMPGLGEACRQEKGHGGPRASDYARGLGRGGQLLPNEACALGWKTSRRILACRGVSGSVPWFIHTKEHSSDIKNEERGLACIGQEPFPSERSKVSNRSQQEYTNVSLLHIATTVKLFLNETT